MENQKRRRKSLKILTEDLITEIISRVPTKDLVRFTSVSRAWCTLIWTDPYFHGLQIERNASLDQPFLLIQKPVESSSGGHSYYQYLIELDLIEDESINLREIRNPFHDRRAYVIASCRGLLLLQQWGTRKMAVFNPATRKHRMVPPNPAGDANAVFCGFGYDRVHHCYKLVTQIKRGTFEVTFELMIYDVNNDVWYPYQCKDTHQYSGQRHFGMECVDGVQYWCFYVNTSQGREIEKIICFLLAVEEFHEVETPDFGEVKYYPNMTILDGRLGLVMEALNVGRYEVWMIEMECDSNSAYSWRWTKILSLFNPRAMLPSPYGVKENTFMIPVCFSACKTRILFVVNQACLLWYEPGKHQFHKLNDHPVNSFSTCVRSFVPSFVGIGIF